MEWYFDAKQENAALERASVIMNNNPLKTDTVEKKYLQTYLL